MTRECPRGATGCPFLWLSRHASCLRSGAFPGQAQASCHVPGKAFLSSVGLDERRGAPVCRYGELPGLGDHQEAWRIGDREGIGQKEGGGAEEGTWGRWRRCNARIDREERLGRKKVNHRGAWGAKSSCSTSQGLCPEPLPPTAPLGPWGGCLWSGPEAWLKQQRGLQGGSEGPEIGSTGQGRSPARLPWSTCVPLEIRALPEVGAAVR